MAVQLKNAVKSCTTPCKVTVLKKFPQNIYGKNGTIFDHCAPPLDLRSCRKKNFPIYLSIVKFKKKVTHFIAISKIRQRKVGIFVLF